MPPRRWKIAPLNESLAGRIASELALPPILARCLAARGCLTSADAQTFMNPRLANLTDPFLLPEMDRAVERLLRAREAGEPLVIFGDYDVDGVTATAILTEFFQTMGWRSSYYLPHRMDEGYGLTRDAARNCLGRYPVKLLVAVDCGSTAVEVVKELRAEGVDVVILDHHQFAEPAPANALVNPCHCEAGAPYRTLCSAGIAFKLIHALLKRGRELGWEGAASLDLKQWLDLVALGTVADMATLAGENRIFVRTGLDRLSSTSRPGLVALKKVAGVDGIVTTTHAGFQLGPRLNAAGRLETALDALELLLCKDAARADRIAAALDAQNQERREIERATVDQVLSGLRRRFDPARDYAIVEGEGSWHIGVVGIVASRVLREFHRPTIILGGDGSGEWRGSGRSIEGFDLAGALRECGDLLVRHGGHAMAAGVTLASTNLELLRERLNGLVKSSIDPEALQPSLRIDLETRLDQITFPVVQTLGRFEPFGQGNPPLIFAARGLRLEGEPRRLGAAGRHCRFMASDGTAARPVVWWNCPETTEFPSRFDLAFSPELNEYNGTCSIQLKAVDIKPC